jgi:uncharacterized damage-inducible protein DinB
MEIPRPDHPFELRPTPGFTPEIGRLVATMAYVRWTTHRTVEGLTQAQLDTLPDPDGNSIGMLLAHIAALDRFYRLITLEGADPAESAHLWNDDPAATLGAPARATIRGEPLKHYLALLEHERTTTLAALAEVDDAWLDHTTPWWGGSEATNRWKWFHVYEDELNHRGQIRTLRRQIEK